MQTLDQLYGTTGANFLRSIGFADYSAGVSDGPDVNVIVDKTGDAGAAVNFGEAGPNGAGDPLTPILNNSLYAKDSAGNLIHGTSGFFGARQDWNVGTDASGIQWVRATGSPTDIRNTDPEYAAVLDKYNPAFWGKYDPVLGWEQPAIIAQDLGVVTKKRGAWWGDYLPLALITAVTAGVALYAAPAIAAEAAAAGQAVGTTAGTAGGVVGSSASLIAPTASDFSLVAAGSNVGLGGVGTAGLGLQVPATLGGTASGLGLASSGALTTALLSPELLAATGSLAGLPGLTAAEAASAAAASGISASASAPWYEQFLRPSNPSLPSSGSSASTVSNTLATAGKAVSAVGTLASLAQKLGLTGASSSSATPASSSGATTLNQFNSSTTSAPASAALVSPGLLVLLAAGVVGLVLIKKGK
jgi:hypothetical protein